MGLVFGFSNLRKLPFNRALRIMIITNGMILLAGAMLAPIYALFVQKVGGDLLDASFAGGTFAFVAGTTVLVSGMYSDALRKKKLVVVLGYLVMGVGFLLYIWVSSIWFLLAVQVLIGFGEAIYNPAFDALYSQHLEPGKTSTEWGAWEATNYFATAVGAVAGGLIVTKFGFTPLFLIMSVLCFSSAAYIHFLPKKTL